MRLALALRLLTVVSSLPEPGPPPSWRALRCAMVDTGRLGKRPGRGPRRRAMTTSAFAAPTFRVGTVVNYGESMHRLTGLAIGRSACDVGKKFRRVWRDVALAGALSIGLGLMSWGGAAAIGPAVLSYNDVWFEADSLRVFLNMSNRWSDQHRMTVHPLFSLLVFPFVKVLRLLGLESPLAVRAVIAAVAASWAASLYGVLRLIGCHRADAGLFSLLGVFSATSLAWFTVPETYAFGSLSIVWALALVALSERRRVSESPYVAVGVLTLSFTITNWMAGITAAVACLPWRRAAQVSVNVLCLVVVLWALQHRVFRPCPSSSRTSGGSHIFSCRPRRGARGPWRVPSSSTPWSCRQSRSRILANRSLGHD